VQAEFFLIVYTFAVFCSPGDVCPGAFPAATAATAAKGARSQPVSVGEAVENSR